MGKKRTHYLAYFPVSLFQNAEVLIFSLRGLQDFGKNFAGDSKVKIPWVRRDLCGPRLLVMEWVDGIRCTDPQAIKDAGINISEFIRCGVVSGLRQLLEVRGLCASGWK